jgi:hypothetical protein
MAPDDRSGKQTEDAVAAALCAAGWEEVTNLNREVGGNFPAVDLVGRKGATRVLFQARGVTNSAGDFTTFPDDARKVVRFGEIVGIPSLYAFRHVTAHAETLRFGTAAKVVDLAEAAEARYRGKNRFHVNIDDFHVDVDHIEELLDLLTWPI